MTETVKYHYEVSGHDFQSAGEASSHLKKELKKSGFSSDVIRRVAISMYEAEINMVIHANGGVVDVEVSPERIDMWLKDSGPGIENISLAMQEGYSTALEDVRSLGFGAGMGLPNIKRYTDEMKIESEAGVGVTIFISVYTDSKK
jgi:serine/threonine-protein kinase RsbT